MKRIAVAVVVALFVAVVFVPHLFATDPTTNTLVMGPCNCPDYLWDWLCEALLACDL